MGGVTAVDEGALAARAKDILKSNDLGGWTKAAPELYPHQWSWDSAFIALGLAHVDVRRAAAELDHLFTAQWSTGKIPHIVYDPDAPSGSYFPDASRWGCAELSPYAPSRGRPASGICQPPVHALAVAKIWDCAQGQDDEERWVRRWMMRAYQRLFAWHRYLATARDPEGSGLVTIYHPWESGCDNSPRWDLIMGRLIVGEMPAYTRFDLEYVGDPTQRPSDDEYDYYLWLVEQLKLARYDERLIYASHPFLVKDVFFSALFAIANDALLRIGRVVDAPNDEMALVRLWAERARRGVHGRWDPMTGLAVDFDLRLEMPLRSATVAGFAPLIAGGLSEERTESIVDVFDSDIFLGHPDLHRPLPVSTSPDDPGFRPRSYWRGPTWPVVTWLLWSALMESGWKEKAGALRLQTLRQVAANGFSEYFEPFTGEALGAHYQSWTAAVVLDWVATNGR